MTLIPIIPALFLGILQTQNVPADMADADCSARAELHWHVAEAAGLEADAEWEDSYAACMRLDLESRWERASGPEWHRLGDEWCRQYGEPGDHVCEQMRRQRGDY